MSAMQVPTMSRDGGTAGMGRAVACTGNQRYEGSSCRATSSQPTGVSHKDTLRSRPAWRIKGIGIHRASPEQEAE
jgi:hypothetical protein